MAVVVVVVGMPVMVAVDKTTMSHVAQPEPEDEELTPATTPGATTTMCTCINARRVFCACAVFANHIGGLRPGPGCPWLCPWARAASSVCTTSTKLLPEDRPKAQCSNSLEDNCPPVGQSPPPISRCCGRSTSANCCTVSRRSTDLCEEEQLDKDEEELGEEPGEEPGELEDEDYDDDEEEDDDDEEEEEERIYPRHLRAPPITLAQAFQVSACIQQQQLMYTMSITK